MGADSRGKCTRFTSVYEYFTSIFEKCWKFSKNTEILGRIDQEVDFYKGVMEILFLPSWVLSPISFVKRPNFDDLRSRKNRNWWFPQEIKNLGDFLEEIILFTSNHEWKWPILTVFTSFWAFLVDFGGIFGLFGGFPAVSIDIHRVPGPVWRFGRVQRRC